MLWFLFFVLRFTLGFHMVNHKTSNTKPTGEIAMLSSLVYIRHELKCGGVIYAYKVVLTSAFCTQDRRENYDIGVQALTISQLSKPFKIGFQYLLKVASVRPHQCFDASTPHKYNIGAIILKQSIEKSAFGLILSDIQQPLMYHSNKMSILGWCKKTRTLSYKYAYSELRFCNEIDDKASRKQLCLEGAGQIPGMPVIQSNETSVLLIGITVNPSPTKDYAILMPIAEYHSWLKTILS